MAGLDQMAGFNPVIIAHVQRLLLLTYNDGCFCKNNLNCFTFMFGRHNDERYILCNVFDLVGVFNLLC